MNITDFLLARIAEDEAKVEACAAVFPGRWVVEDRGYRAHVVCDGPNFRHVAELDQKNTTVDWLGGALQMIADFDPARVLAECAAKRAIIKLSEAVESMDYQIANEWGGDVDGTGESILSALAAVYKDHPDYQEEWA